MTGLKRPTGGSVNLTNIGSATAVEERINGELERISGEVRCGREARNGGPFRAICAADDSVLVLQQLSPFERKFGEYVAF